MYQYKVVWCQTKEAEEIMNTWAKEGWRVHAVTANIWKGYGVIITFEKEV